MKAMAVPADTDGKKKGAKRTLKEEI
jgi:hypothetical protein